jgi:hypothetical protein
MAMAALSDTSVALQFTQYLVCGEGVSWLGHVVVKFVSYSVH